MVRCLKPTARLETLNKDPKWVFCPVRSKIGNGKQYEDVSLMQQILLNSKRGLGSVDGVDAVVSLK